MLRKIFLALALVLSTTFSVGQVTQAPPGGVRTPSIQGQATTASDDACGAGQYWLRPVAGTTNTWRMCNNGVVQHLGSLTGLETVSTTLQAAFDAACAASPIHAVYIPPTYAGKDTFTNTCNTTVLDLRSSSNFASGEINIRTFGADGTGNGYVDMTTNVASKNVSGCYNMTSAQVVGKYLHVLRAGPSGGIFKSLITGFSGITCTVADFPSASVTAGGWVSSNDDDAPAFQSALNLALIYGAEIVVPPGNYFLLSPMKLPAMQSSTTPWNISSIRIRGLGGNYSVRLYYVQNATTGPMRALIEGPTVRTATTGWSQTGTSLTITMASNPYHVGDLLDFWSPTAGANNSGATNNPVGYGVTGGYYVTAVTSTTVTMTSDLNQTASATEVGELSQMGKPLTPFISGLDFETLDYPYGGKTGTFLANGIDTHAYTSFDISNNYLGNLKEGIRIYRSWLGTITRNECYGANICVHAPKNLGAVNAIRFKDNNFDAYGIYGLIMEANQDGGSYENSYIDNEYEGTSATTRADFVAGDSGAEIRWGYSETAGSNEISYTNAIVTGSNVQFQSGFTIGIRVSGNGSHIQMNGTAVSYNGRLVAPTVTRVAGAGTFPAGRDVYVTVTGYDPTDTLETNYNDLSAHTTTPAITNTTLNDRVQVNVSSITDFAGLYSQYCVYEADVATGGAAPTLPNYIFLNSTVSGAWKKVGCANLGTAINVDATATGTLMNPLWGIDNRNFYNSWYGVPKTAARNQATAGSEYWYGGDGSLNISALSSVPTSINSPNDFRNGGGATCIAGTCFGTARSGSANPNYPNEFNSTTKIPYGMVIRNAYANYGNPSIGGVFDNSLWMFCNNTAGCAGTPVASDWVHFGELHNRQYNECAGAPPATGAWVAGDYCRNITPAVQSTVATIYGWLCVTGGSPGTWKPIYVNDLASPIAIGSTTPNTATFTTETVNNVLNSPGQNNLGNTQVAGSSVSPLNVAGGPLLLFDATDGSSCTSNGASVSTWTDQSTGHYNATPQGGSAAPTCVTNAVNGQNAVSFNGTTQQLGNATFPFGSTNNGSGGLYSGQTFFVVMKMGASPVSGLFFVTGADNWIDVLNNNTTRCWLGNGGAPQAMWTQDTSNYHVWQCEMNAGANNTAIMRRDGTQVSSYSTTNRAWTDTGFGLGATTAGTSQRSNVSIAYVVLYGSVLSATDRETVATYLQNRFAINMSNDYNPAFTIKQSGINKAYVTSTGQFSSAGSTGGFVTLAPQTNGLAAIAGGPVFVCDPSSESYTNGASVTSCTDRGSGGHNATSTGTAPIFTTGVFAGGQKPSFRFNGSAGILQTATFTLNTPATICGVVKSNTRSTQYLWDGFTPWSDAEEWDHLFNSGSSGQNVFGYPNGDLQPHVWCSVTLSGAPWGIGYQDGNKFTFGGGETGSVNLAGVTLGGLGNGTNMLNGDMGIVAVWNSALSQTDINNVQNAMLPWLAQQVTTYDASVSNTFNQTLSANYTAGNILNGTLGQIVMLNICQDATGGWTYAAPPNSTGMAAVPATANGCWGQSFQWDGTAWRAKSGLVGLTGKAHSNGTAEGFTTVAYSATPTFDASLGNTFKITLTGNVTSATLSNVSQGQPLRFIICLDAVGSETFTWPTNMTGTMTIGATASKCNAQDFVYDGTNAVATSPGVTNQ